VGRIVVAAQRIAVLAEDGIAHIVHQVRLEHRDERGGAVGPLDPDFAVGHWRARLVVLLFLHRAVGRQMGQMVVLVVVMILLLLLLNGVILQVVMVLSRQRPLQRWRRWRWRGGRGNVW